MLDPNPNEERRSLTAALLALVVGGIAAPTLRALDAGKEFPVFDALLFRGKPNLVRQGLQPMAAVADIWRSGLAKTEVDEPGILAALERLRPGTETIFVDIENWPLLGASPEVLSKSVDNYTRTAQIIRRARPGIKFGFYGIAPTCTYWPIARQDKEQLAQWKAVNRALRPLAELVDFVLPSLYTFYDDPAGWSRFAAATFDEARQYGKPIYPFLWNEYFDGNPTLGGKQVNTAAWREELRFCRSQADGLVLWGGYDKNWSESEQWWQTVIEFRRTTARSSGGVLNHADG